MSTAWLMLGLAVWPAALGLAARYAHGQARRARAAERVHLLRLLHDTVLHGLEVMALPSEQDGVAPERSLRELRRTARLQADRLRRAMSELTDGPSAQVTATLHRVVDEFTAVGLRAQVVAAQDVPDLPAERQAALRDGVRAALGNVLKHSGVARALVRVERADAGVRVVVRDDGRGFDPHRTAPGFGVRQCVVARLREAGGTATLDSRPSGGTRVELWVPS